MHPTVSIDQCLVQPSPEKFPPAEMGTFSPKPDVFIHHLPSAQRAMWKTRWKGCQSQWAWKTGKPRYKRTAAHVAACTRPTEVQARGGPIVERGRKHKAPPQPRSYLQLTTAHKEKISFLQWSLESPCVYEPHFKGRPHAKQ